MLWWPSDATTHSSDAHRTSLSLLIHALGKPLPFQTCSRGETWQLPGHTWARFVLWHSYALEEEEPAEVSPPRHLPGSWRGERSPTWGNQHSRILHHHATAWTACHRSVWHQAQGTSSREDDETGALALGKGGLHPHATRRQQASPKRLLQRAAVQILPPTPAQPRCQRDLATGSARELFTKAASLWTAPARKPWAWHRERTGSKCALVLPFGACNDQMLLLPSQWKCHYRTGCDWVCP